MVDRPDSPRERILTAAAGTLQAGGAAGFTTRQIAAAAGVNPGLIHYHFGSLGQLRAVLAERYFGQTLANRRAALLAPGPFMERWHALVDVVEAEGRTTGRIDTELRAAAGSMPEIRMHVAAFAEGWRDALGTALVGAAQEYGLSPGLAPPLAELLEAFTTGMVSDRASGAGIDHAAALEWFDAMVLSLAQPG